MFVFPVVLYPTVFGAPAGPEHEQVLGSPGAVVNVSRFRRACAGRFGGASSVNGELCCPAGSGNGRTVWGGSVSRHGAVSREPSGAFAEGARLPSVSAGETRPCALRRCSKSGRLLTTLPLVRGGPVFLLRAYAFRECRDLFHVGGGVDGQHQVPGGNSPRASWPAILRPRTSCGRGVPCPRFPGPFPGSHRGRKPSENPDVC